jgi:hypothetical protein
MSNLGTFAERHVPGAPPSGSERRARKRDTASQPVRLHLHRDYHPENTHWSRERLTRVVD